MKHKSIAVKLGVLLTQENVDRIGEVIQECLHSADLKACIEIARWAEDQFTRWHSEIERDSDALSATDSVFTSPFVFEQTANFSPFYWR